MLGALLMWCSRGRRRQGGLYVQLISLRGLATNHYFVKLPHAFSVRQVIGYLKYKEFFLCRKWGMVGTQMRLSAKLGSDERFAVFPYLGSCSNNCGDALFVHKIKTLWIMFRYAELMESVMRFESISVDRR